MESSEHTSQNARHEKDTQKAKEHPWPLRSLLAVMGTQFAVTAVLWRLEPHPLSRNTLLAGQRGTILALTLFYTLLVTRIGPAFMRHRKPMELRTALYVYNALQIFANAYIFLKVCSIIADYNWRCEPIPPPIFTPKAAEVVYAYNFFFWLKVSDLIETIFFVLRKKDKQVSFLHVYHHSIMVLLGWYAREAFPGGHGISLGLFNSLTHTVMYTYYLYSLISPGNIWWKKFITLLQIAHQAAIILHVGQVFFHNPCNHPVFEVFLLVMQVIFVMFMFIRFYYRTYIQKSSVKTQ